MPWTPTETCCSRAYNNAQQRENFFNQTDLTFSFDTGSVGHEFLVGVEVGEQTTDNVRMTGLFNGTDLAFLVPAGDPMVSAPVTFAPTDLDNTNRGRATIAAAYVQDQVRLSPQWLAILGLRFDSFDMDFTDRRGAGTEIETSDDLLSPRAGLIYKPVENLSLYASYSMAYVPRSGAQLASLTPSNAAFDPEEFENIEVGAKWDVSPQLCGDGRRVPARPQERAGHRPGRPDRQLPGRRPADRGRRDRRQRAGYRGMEHPGRLRLAGRPPDERRAAAADRGWRLRSSRSTSLPCGTAMTSRRPGAPGSA